MNRLAGRLACVIAGAGAALLAAHSASAQSRSCLAPVDSSSVVAGQWTAPLDRRVSVHASGLSLRDALDRVAAAAGVRLSYSADLLPLDRSACVSAVSRPVGDVLSQLLTGVNVAPVSAGGDQVVLAPQAPSSAPKEPEQSATLPEMLDRVVVTGSAIPAPERELTVGLDVVNGRQLARENTTTLSDALDGYVPGMWSWAQSPGSMVTSYASIRGASSFGLSYPKIYIDGIEVANPLLVTRFDPQTIDRIEVIRGPQGSALYGTDAISGVVNIVTRHDGADADGEHALLRSSAGLTQSAFAHNVIAQEHAASFVSGSSTQSFGLNVVGSSTGDFIPNGYSRDLLASASARVVGDQATFTGTARFFTEQAGAATSPLLAMPFVSHDSGTYGPGAMTGGGSLAAASPSPQSIHEYTLGSTVTLASNDRWTHTFLAGVDGYRLANVETSFTAIPSVADSALRAAQGGADRATLRASSVLQLNGSDPTHATITFSAEHSMLREESEVADPQTMIGRPGASPQTVTTYSNATLWQNSSGLTAQANGVVDDRFYITGGARLERDSRLVSTDEVSLLPMLGLADVEDLGPFTVKLRAAYGEGIRPPSTAAHTELGQPRYGSPTQPTLSAEKQAGTEAGLDVVFRRMLSLKVTRFDQRASGLIQQVAIPLDSNDQSHRMADALENVGEISNKGWELEAQTNVSRLALTATWASVESRVIKLAQGYTGDLMTGDRMLDVPSGTASLNAQWLAEQWHVSLASSRAFDWINYDEIALGEAYLSGEHPARDLVGQQLRKYWRRYTGGTRLRASASRDIRGGLAFEITADNLLNYQVNEPDNITVVPGRTVMTGFTLKF